MTYFDTTLRVRHPCPFCDLSGAFPEAEMVQWCNRRTDILHVTVSSPSELGPLLRSARGIFGIREIVRDGRSALTLTQDCGCLGYRSVVAIAEEAGCWLIPPIRYRGGWESHRVLSPRKSALQRMVSEIRKVGDVEIVSHRSRDRLNIIHDLGLVPIHLLERLTDRQVEALLIASEHGLFETPARVRMSDVAERQGTSRSTYGEHLRKAMNRILVNAYPALKFRGETEPSSAKRSRSARKPPTRRVRLDPPAGRDSGFPANRAFARTPRKGRG